MFQFQITAVGQQSSYQLLDLKDQNATLWLEYYQLVIIDKCTIMFTVNNNSPKTLSVNIAAEW